MINKLAISLSLACLLAGCCCRPPEDTAGRGGNFLTHTQAVLAGRSAYKLGFALINYTGASIRAVYLSPSDSTGWEENVLAGDKLDDGDTANIRFSSEERASFWDLRVEGSDGRYAEWKSINLGDVSRITLRLKLVGETVVVAEVE